MLGTANLTHTNLPYVMHVDVIQNRIHCSYLLRTFACSRGGAKGEDLNLLQFLENLFGEIAELEFLWGVLGKLFPEHKFLPTKYVLVQFLGHDIGIAWCGLYLLVPNLQDGLSLL
jgi:hypothetical protein